MWNKIYFAFQAIVLLCAVPADAQQNLLYRTLKEHTTEVWAVAFSPDGKMLATASRDSTVKIWDTDKFKLSVNLDKHTKPVTSLAFSADGKFLASAGKDNSIIIWKADSLPDVSDVLVGHTQSVFSVAFSSDGKYLASGSLDDSVRIWRNYQFKLLDTLRQQKDVYSVAFAPNSGMLAVSQEDNRKSVLDGEKVPAAQGYFRAQRLCLVCFLLSGRTLSRHGGRGQDDKALDSAEFRTF